ncbi:hypothetical protein G0U57_006132, partial [Chelydra serpentina]
LTNYKALLAKYNTNYSNLSEFVEFLSEEKREQFRSIISKGHLLDRTALQASLGSADTVAQSITTAVVMRHASWLHLSDFPKELQLTVENLQFEGPQRFAAKTDESLHMLKNSRVMLKSLGVYMPMNKKK